MYYYIKKSHRLLGVDTGVLEALTPELAVVGVLARQVDRLLVANHRRPVDTISAQNALRRFPCTSSPPLFSVHCNEKQHDTFFHLLCTDFVETYFGFRFISLDFNLAGQPQTKDIFLLL